MSRAEVLEFLRDESWLVLATLDADGSPFGDVVPATLDGEMLCFCVARNGRSQANIARDDRVCCSSDRFPSYYEIKGVTVHGRAREVTDPAPAARIASLCSAPGLDAGADRAVYALGLDDVSSFDFAKIRNKY
ncbi:MAG TPA: pyridoxamine 5'-phosphate oxidase family protein [Candidatus Bathyarchaeia archaeon]|nr:pyridoxamine 5'-phosphate oxidase family protein [Candidatus Bathyarchaeia archaeon]